MARTPPSARRKWALIAGYWCIQAALLCLAWPMIFAEWRPNLNSLSLPDSVGVFTCAAWTLTITFIQAAFVLPIRPPTVSRGNKIVSAVVAALSIAFIAAAVCWLLGCVLLGMGFRAFDISRTILGWPFMAGFGAGLLAVPFFIHRFRRGVPLRLSIAIAAFAAGIIITALILGAISAADALLATKLQNHVRVIAIIALASLLLSWGFATPLLITFARRTHPEHFLSRLANTLFLGTLIEAAAIIPFDVMVRKKSDCYCAEGTFFALTALWSIGFLLLGPMVFLLPIGRRRKRLIDGRCPVCGYDLRATPSAPHCPECGSGWKSQSV